MRTLVALMLVLAIPTFAAAQQAADPADATPVVELERTTPEANTTVERVAPATDVEVEKRDAPVEDAAAMQEPGTRQWWWLVGAIVVGGLILAVIL